MWCSPGWKPPKRSNDPAGYSPTGRYRICRPPGFPGGYLVFHVKHHIWEEVAVVMGLELGDAQLGQLSRYADWLVKEAITAGGLGPSEGSRIESRHIADSLLFSVGFEEVPAVVRDLGSGVGLPGIPLAIAYPDTHFQLVDRSGRRIDLVKRASRILDLPNVSVALGEIASFQGEVPGIVSRASLPPDLMVAVAERQLQPGGTIVLGGSWKNKPVRASWETREIRIPVLDHVVWLLIMRRQ